MALLTRPELLGAPLRESVERTKTAAARTELRDVAESTPLNTNFDVFLSHSTKSAREVLALRQMLESMKYRVYVDWIDDGELPRSRVTPANAARVRLRMVHSRCLLVHASEGATVSRWVPWELGLADGLRRPVAIVPVLSEKRRTSTYHGVEFFGLYPYVDFARDEANGVRQPWINQDADTYVSLNAWLTGKRPFRRDGSGKSERSDSGKSAPSRKERKP